MSVFPNKIGRGALVRVAAVVAAAGISGAALAAPASAGWWQPQYVALGDSYAAGVGAGDYEDETCYRSANAYPVLAAEEAGAELSFDACSGATVDDVVADQLGDLTWRTREVSVGVGGNDAGFSTVLGACAGTDTALCEAAIANARSVITGSLPGELDGLYDRIEDRSPFADVSVVGNPRLFSGATCAGSLAITPDEQTLLNETADLLADTTAAVAADHGFDFIDVREAFTGHGVCSADPWILGYVGTLESFHPNAAGQVAYAEAVTPYLERC